MHWGSAYIAPLAEQANWLEIFSGSMAVSSKTLHVLIHCERIDQPNHPLTHGWIADALDMLADAPIIAAVMVEVLMDRGNQELTLEVIDECLARYPNSLRLKQLHVLHLSRQDQLENAIELGEALLREENNNEETIGILSGAYKRLWSKHGSRKWLERSHHLYARGWSVSGGSNLYLGINASATDIWLGNSRNAAKLATEIHQILSKRLLKMQNQKVNSQVHLGIWDQLTLAEATLQMQNFDEAADLFAFATRQLAGRVGQIEVAIAQARKLLEAFGWTNGQINNWLSAAALKSG